jgi:hypothetical protein
MNQKTRMILMTLTSLLLLLLSRFDIGSKLVLGAVFLASALFITAAWMLVRSDLSALKCLGLFLIFVLVFNLVAGLMLHENRMILVNSLSRYHSAQDPFTHHAYDGIFYSFSTFLSQGNHEMQPFNQTGRAVSLLISMSGYLGLALLVLLLHRGFRRDEAL